jgi:hypothetical protein
MTATTLDFIKENSVEIGSTFIATIQLCEAPNLTQYTGICQVRSDENSSDILFSPTISVVSHDIFTLTIPFGAWINSIVAGSFKYDVLFYKSDDRFYAVRGNMILIKPITKFI